MSVRISSLILTVAFGHFTTRSQVCFYLFIRISRNPSYWITYYLLVSCFCVNMSKNCILFCKPGSMDLQMFRMVFRCNFLPEKNHVRCGHGLCLGACCIVSNLSHCRV